MRVDIKALSDSELQEQGFNNTSGGMHGFGLYTDDVLSAVCITTEIPDSLNKETGEAVCLRGRKALRRCQKTAEPHAQNNACLRI